ncbi:MAG TPA: LysM peptidoglycan-binding domain-containing protein [Chloroflexota bacterium]
MPSLPSLTDLELVLRSPSSDQLTAVGIVIGWIAWLLWVWLSGTTFLRISLVLAERTSGTSAWTAHLRAVSNRVTLSLVTRAIDASLAGELLVRTVVPTPQPFTGEPRVAYVHVQRQHHAQDSDWPPIAAAQHPVMAPDLEPGDVLYTVQPGDNLSRIAHRFYGDPARFSQIVQANLGRDQTGGLTLRDARFIYPGWQLVIPAPTQTIHTDDDGTRWYTVRAGDTLWGISARLLGDGKRYPELFADNQGAELGDGHVLINPNLIWPGLHLRLPSEPEPHDAEPALPVPSEDSAEHTQPASPLPVADQPDRNGRTGAQNDASLRVDQNAGFQNVAPDPTPVSAPTDETAVRVAPDAQSPGLWPPLWLRHDARTGLEIAGGLTTAALLALSLRRRRRIPLEPESDTRLDVHAFTLAEPAAVVTSRSTGAGDDPHGIVLGELVAGELLRHAQVGDLMEVQVVSVIGGRSGSIVTLTTSLEDRPLLVAALSAETQLARRVEISRSPAQDTVVQLQGVHREALARVAIEDCPVLLCLGMLPDSRSYLVGWRALGHVLVAAQPGTTDAEEHLAALIATLAGQCPPSALQLFTVAGGDTWMKQLASLPQQRAVVDAADREAVAKLLTFLRTELEVRQRVCEATARVELVLLASELTALEPLEDLTHLLSHGEEHGIRVLAATADTAAERGPLVDRFGCHIVFGLEDEEASIRLLGKPSGLTLAEPGRMLVQLGRRNEVEVLALHLTEDGRRDLLASLGVVDAVASAASAVSAAPAEAADAGVRESEIETPGNAPDEGPENTVVVPLTVGIESNERQLALDTGSDSVPDPGPASSASGGPEARDTTFGGDRRPSRLPRTSSVERRKVASGESPAVVPSRIRQLLTVSPLIVDCDEATVWSANGRLGIGQSSPVEVLLYLAAAPLLHQGRLADWDGVSPEAILAEVWAPRARTPENKDSGQTWLAKNLGRLQDEIGRAAGGLDADVVIKRRGCLRLNEKVVGSDVEGFMAAVERARGAQGAQRVPAAEQAVATLVPGLLSRVVRNPRAAGPKIELYRWLAEPDWERAASRLEALGREAAVVLGRAYRDAGRHEDALGVYDQLIGEDPPDLRVREGLLLAAAGTGDAIQLERAWQQVCACAGSEDDTDMRSLYDRLLRDVRSASNGTAGATRENHVA